MKSSIYRLLVAFALVVFVMGLAPAQTASATFISVPTVWNSTQFPAEDVYVQSGASLTIAAGVQVTLACSDASGGGVDSNRIEISVDENAVLNIQPGARLLAANGEGNCWYGIIYLTGSSGTIDTAIINGATRVVSIYDSSPTIINT